MAALTNGKHEAVLQAFLADPARVGWRAYAKVYPEAKQRACESAWSRLLKNAAFRARLGELEAAVTDKVVAASAITVERVINELALLGFANAKHFLRLDAFGDPAVDLANLTDDQFASLQSVSVEDFKDGRGEDARDVRRVTFKLHPKIPALVAIGEHLGAFKRKGQGASPAPAETPEPDKVVETTPPTRLELARRIAFLLRVPDGAPAPAKAAAPDAAEPPREKRAPR